jgi:hypothetical protein
MFLLLHGGETGSRTQMFLLGRAVLQTASGSDLIFPLSTLYACPRCMDTS